MIVVLSRGGLHQDLRVVSRSAGRFGAFATPEMKLAGQEGRKKIFYPYGKTFAQTIREQD